MKKYHDCQLKSAILTTLAEQDQSGLGMTTRELFDIVQHPSWDSFRVSVYQHWRRGGYLVRSKVEGSREFRYSISKKGREHTHQNAYQTIQRRRDNIQHKLNALLADEPSFQAAVEQEVSRRVETGGGHVPSGGHSGPVSAPTASVNESQVIKVMKEKDDRIAQLETMIMHMKRSQAPTGPQSTGTQVQQQTKTPEQEQKQKEERQRIKRRRRLSEFYASRNIPLDADFFLKWGGGDIMPYKIKFQKYGASGSVEIFSRSNEELRRGHCHSRPLHPSAILQCRFQIVSMNEKGITVRSHVLPDMKTRMIF